MFSSCSLFALLISLLVAASSLSLRPHVYLRKTYSPYGRQYFESYLRQLNSKNVSDQNRAILGKYNDEDTERETVLERFRNYTASNTNQTIDDDDSYYYDLNGNPVKLPKQSASLSWSNKKKKSENFEVIKGLNFSFANIGGYDNIKSELRQCIDILNTYEKYREYNVRIPKGIVLEGPPGNGKTMIAKGFAGETNTSFISVSGSQFQEKYVGVGQTRVRELFQLARENAPCVIFIDEIDAIGRARTSEAESAGAERDSTLNELLVQLDGFKTTQGIFLIAATNRVDLLDQALLRPGRIDKRVYIGMPDADTRKAILEIHLKGKPHNPKEVRVADLVDITAGLSGAQIENMLNEAMLNALRRGSDLMTHDDIDLVVTKMMVGWQPTEHKYSADIIDRIAIHEMGHAIVGYFSKHHSKVNKVVINLSSPKSPGYTMFERTTSMIFTREALFEHLMILLAGRIAEEIFYELSITTGAINDFDEAFKLAERMIIHYGMGKVIIYPSSSDKYKQKIDDEVSDLINDAYKMSRIILEHAKELISECAVILKTEKILKIERINDIIRKNHAHLLRE